MQWFWRFKFGDDSIRREVHPVPPVLIFRVTQRLAKKIKVIPSAPLPPGIDPLLDWTIHLFRVSRWQCIMLTSSSCLYTVVTAGKGVSNATAFLERGVAALHEHMLQDRAVGLYASRIAPMAKTAVFCRASDRRVLGSMNNLAFLVESYLLEANLPLRSVNERLNTTPMSLLGYLDPKTALLSLPTAP